jgi:hypothetical protein
MPTAGRWAGALRERGVGRRAVDRNQPWWRVAALNLPSFRAPSKALHPSLLLERGWQATRSTRNDENDIDFRRRLRAVADAHLSALAAADRALPPRGHGAVRELWTC